MPRRKSRAIDEVEYLKLRIFDNLWGKCDAGLLFKNYPQHTVLTGTGRAAMRIILEHLSNKNVLRTRNDQILIPSWICQSLIYTMQRFCHPTINYTKNVKAIMVYHQYGFPQNMDDILDFCNHNNVIIIEDCANVYQGYYKERLLGTFGYASIFSFAKLFPSVLGGALTTRDEELLNYANKRLNESMFSNLTYTSRLLYECLKETRLRSFSADFQEMAYALTDRSFKIKKLSLRAISKELQQKAIERRLKNYHFILDYFSDRPEYFDGLEREGVVPYVVPLFAPDELLFKLQSKLRENNVNTGIYHFDINRNLLNPKFRRCIWIPVHQGLDQDRIAWICELIKTTEGM